jgi:sortase B
MTHRRNAQKVLMVLTAAALVVSLVLLCYYIKQYRDAGRVYDNLAEIAFDNGNEDKPDAGGKSIVNHAALSTLNGDYVAWLRVDGTPISYPVVQSLEPEYYLRRDYYGNKSVAGTVFMDFNNDKSFSDTNTMIYGHNLRDGSMFAPLKEFLNTDFFNSNRYIYIDTPNRALVYEIFAVYETASSRVPLYTGILEQERFDEFTGRINTLAAQSTGTTLTPQDKILTLSTCGYSIKNARIIVHAKFVSD